MATSITDAMTLRALYGTRKNPSEEKAKVIGGMLENSGFAKPYMAYVMGQEMSKAEDWDKARDDEAQAAAESSSKQAADASQREYASKAMESIIKVSEHDPVAATQMLKIETENGGNPYLQQFKGITFNANTKDGWATVGNSGDGYTYAINFPKLAELGKLGASPDSEEYKEAFNKAVFKIGEGKPADLEAVQKGDKVVYVDKKTRKEVAGFGGPKWNPKGEGGSNGNAGNKPRKPGIIAKDIATTAAKISRAKESLTSLQGKEDPALAELNAAMQALKDEYKLSSGKEWTNQSGNAPSSPAAKSTTPAKRAMSEADARKALAAKGITGANQEKYITMYKNAGAVK